MKLVYVKGENFGDALNPIIFNHYLSELLNDNDTEVLLGIGSIIGLARFPESTRKIYVFSSGFGEGDKETYGTLPELDDRYEILCVRGPLTAALLNLPKEVAISDGALLLPLVLPNRVNNKRYSFSYMPHVGTINMYEGWKKICESCDIHFINPKASPESVLEELCATDVLISEAMHGVITADAYRIPWIAVKTNANINEFKWKDYLQTVELAYNPIRFNTLYSFNLLKKIFIKRLKPFHLQFLSFIPAACYSVYQYLIVIPRIKKKLRKIKSANTQLCKTSVLLQRQNELLTIINQFKESKIQTV